MLMVPGVLAAAVLAAVVSLCFADTVRGWHWSIPAEWAGIAIWRVPRLIASMAAGVMLGVAGTLLQRTTGTPMASPELLGVSGGAMLGVLCESLLSASPPPAGLFGASLAGSFNSLAAMRSEERR